MKKWKLSKRQQEKARYNMCTFSVVHAVDYSTGVARIGKCHTIDKRELVVAESLKKRIKEMRDKNRIAEE